MLKIKGWRRDLLKNDPGNMLKTKAVTKNRRDCEIRGIDGSSILYDP
jgi:hypothetical protein